MNKSSVFEETYTNYLARIGGLDFKKIADRLGAEMVAEELIIPFFGKRMRISAAGISEPSGGRPNFSVCVVLFKYLLLCPDHDPVEKDWVSFKDFKDSAPFAGAFFNYTEVPLAKHFSGRLEDLKVACQGIQGHPPQRSPMICACSSVCCRKFRFCYFSTMTMKSFRPSVRCFLKDALKITWIWNALPWWACCCLNI